MSNALNHLGLHIGRFEIIRRQLDTLSLRIREKAQFMSFPLSNIEEIMLLSTLHASTVTTNHVFLVFKFFLQLENNYSNSSKVYSVFSFLFLCNASFCFNEKAETHLITTLSLYVYCIGDKHKSEIVLLSTAANINSRYTSMVGVDQKSKKIISDAMVTRHVPLYTSTNNIKQVY